MVISHRPDTGDSTVFFGGVGVRRSPTTVVSYTLTAVAGQVGDVVAEAGGWLCDRVRAGWRVTILVPETSDVRPLDILGVRAAPMEVALRHLAEDALPALAMAADVFASDELVGADIRRMIAGGATEVTLWGNCAELTLGPRVDRMQYRPSAAAQAFKRHALIACGIASMSSWREREVFHSCSAWYPPEGSDLTPVS